MKKFSFKRNVPVWWIIFGILLTISLAMVVRLNIRLMNESEFALKNAAALIAETIRKDVEHQSSTLNLLCKSMNSESDFTEAEDTQMKLIKDSLGAVQVGVYKHSQGYGRTALGTTFVPGVMDAWERAKQSKLSIMRVYNEYSNGREDYMVVVPWYGKNNEIVGMAFAAFPVEDFMKLFSSVVYNGAGYACLCDVSGNIIIPAEQMIESKEVAGFLLSDNFTTESVKEILNSEVNQKGLVDMVFLDGKSYYLCVENLAGYEDYKLIAIVDKLAIFLNLSPAAKITTTIALIILVLVLIQALHVLVDSRRKKNEISDAINFDELTGLMTKVRHKQVCIDTLTHSKDNFAYVVSDVSEFKFINSTYGYEYGNTVLKHIANMWSNALGKDESVSRTSGDHFAALLRYDDIEELTDRINHILERCSELPAEPAGRKPAAVFTCGVYVVEDDRDINRIRARANVARKGLKKAITNQIAFYSDEDFIKNMEDHELEAELVNVIQNGQLEVFLQPKYGISDEKVIGAEALVRWNHPKKGLLSPNTFIPIAEQNGFIKDIDFYVFTTVCERLRKWVDNGKKPIRISVNFSRVHLFDDDFVGKLVMITKEQNVSPSWLEIELTETAIYDEMSKLLDTMYLIKEAGFGLSMDDFGSGYSSLHLLREMPVDVLKLDKGFLDNCNSDNQRVRKVISHVISMAKDLQINVLAEGVETEDQKAFLKEANCDMIQGYYYAKPMPMNDFEKYIE